MRLIITIGPDVILADDQIISDQVGAYIVRNSKLIQDIPMATTNTKKVCVDFRATRKTPGVWQLPFNLLRRIWTIPILFAMFSCSSVYWESSKQTASGKHRYYTQGWPYIESCKSYSQQPIKPLTFKRYSYWRFNR